MIGQFDSLHITRKRWRQSRNGEWVEGDVRDFDESEFGIVSIRELPSRFPASTQEGAKSMSSKSGSW